MAIDVIINTESDDCETETVHGDAVAAVRKDMPSDDALEKTSDLFKVLGDPTRAKIIRALSIAELCVCDIAEVLGMTNSAISHQLRILKQARLVKNRRDGKTVFYRLDDDHISQVFSIAFEHISEE
ncbi:MAG: ArsR/SmtB family transcription factor [Oscillospiraceae bacterium]